MRLFSSYFERPRVAKILRGEEKKREKKNHAYCPKIKGKDRIALLGFNP